MRAVARGALAAAMTIGTEPALAQRARLPVAVRIVAPAPALRPESFYADSGRCGSGGARADDPCVHGTMTVVAEVDDPAATRAEVAINDGAEVVPVRDGRVVVDANWVEGNNRVSVAVRRGGRVVRDSMTRYVGATAPTLRIRAAWAWPRERPVVRVVTPSGGRCEDVGDAVGARLACDAAGPGRYRLVLLRRHDEADSSDSPARPFEVQGLLDLLGSLDDELLRAAGARRARLLAERRETLRRLDEYAAPAATPSGATVVVTLFAGSPAEQRWTFRVGARDVGEREVGSFFVTESMLARRGAP